jgi:hypothetical protein
MKRDEKDPFRVERRSLQVTTRAEAECEDRAYWLSQTPEQRLRHLEALRELNYGPEVINQGLQRVFAVLERPRR